MINFINVSKTFSSREGAVEAIKDVSLSIEDKEVFGIIGESGAGKSTLLRFINALELPDEGTVKVNNTDVSTLKSKDLRTFKKEIGMIFQQFNLLGNKTVRENILLPLELHKFEDHLDINQVLDFVGLTEQQNRYPRQLSGGQKQRIGIARALITRPKILLCDEPTSALDQSTKKEIIHLLKRTAEEFDITILIVTHELDLVKQLCQRVAILEKGNLVDVVNVNQENKTEDYNVSYSALAREVLLSD